MTSHSYEELFQNSHTKRQEHVPQDKLGLNNSYVIRGATSKLTPQAVGGLHVSAHIFLRQQRRKAAHIWNWSKHIVTGEKKRGGEGGRKDWGTGKGGEGKEEEKKKIRGTRRLLTALAHSPDPSSVENM